ncbi:T9SS C-terminal target domain-containing protein [Sorangium sp. So ce388]|uniref:T9SS C-terminal target domain-containing protein n=1 Tax=Sorangium sp. So ce388 TaxID=3133309 RepID=UPI003F5BF6B5
MRTSRIALVCASALAVAMAAACGDDDGGASTASTSTASGTGGGGDGGGGDGGGGKGGGGDGPDCAAPVEIAESIEADATWSADSCYLMKGTIFVEEGATLTIEPGTTIMGDKESLATLVVKPGARINAKGTADKPIVFTSQSPKGERSAGDWGGVMLLGNAPINVPGGRAEVEGIVGVEYGGDVEDDSSGVLQYVRIEFSGILLSQDNEVNGLTLAGVGSRTTVDHVMVHHTLDDCFEFFGGTVNAKHLLCAQNGDDGFDWDLGYVGKLQFLALQQDPTVADDTNGFEGDNDADGSENTPVSEPTIYNVTLCGKNKEVDKQQYGMLLRRGTKAHIFNTIVTGFEAGLDLRNDGTEVELASSIISGNVNAEANIAYEETDVNESTESTLDDDDDGGVDEVAWFEGEATNSVVDPQLAGCFAATPDFRPAATLTDNAATPPDDGFFDAEATYIGAFKADDDWATGAWVSFDVE